MSKDVYGSLYGRFDAEFFDKKYIANEKAVDLKQSVFLSELAIITDGEHGSPDLDDESGIIYLSGNNVKDNQIDFENVRYCSEKLHIKNARSSVKKNTVLMSIVGTVGKASVVHDDVIANTDRNVATIKLSALINPHYLSIFLNCKYGTNQTGRFSTGNVQPLLNLSQIKQLKICNFSISFQSEIEKLSHAQDAKLKQSKASYAQAETLLLDTLGLADFSPSTEKVNIKSFKDSFVATGRLDAEYYQPKYDDYVQRIRCYKNGFKSITDVLTIPIKNGTTPNSAAPGYKTLEHYFVRVEAFQQNLTIDETLFHSVDSEDYFKYKANLALKNDILVSMTGTIGAVVIYSPNKPALINQNVMRLRCNTNLINTESLAVYLKTIGKVLLERVQTGNVQPYVNTSNFETLIVPLIDSQIQSQIADFVQQSFTLKAQSEHLLNVAKRAVEIAIETDERAAMVYLNEQLELQT